MIYKNSRKTDLVKWCLSDKFIAKNFAKNNGFKVAKIYQYAKYPFQLKNIYKNYVIKPVDMCNSEGIFLMKDGINLIDRKKYSFQDIQKNLVKLRSTMKQEYYMHATMYNYRIPNTGYIMEELLLDDNNFPCDYKCYTFNGKIYFVVCTFNRRFVNQEQEFNSVWMTRNWNPIPFKMIQNGYKYQKLKKPKGYEKMINLVENVSKKLNRHCRIDVYLINGDVYFGEFTFFTGAFLHTRICNNILGLIWKINPDNLNKNKKSLENEVKKCIPKYYNLDFIE